MLSNANTLMVLIDFYVRPCSRHPRHEAPAVEAAINMLQREGMLVVAVGATDMYAITEKGEFFIEKILSMPFPECKWFIPDSEEPA